MPKGNLKILEAKIDSVQIDFVRLELISGDYRGHEVGEMFSLGKNEIVEMYVVPSWVKEGTEVKVTHRFSNVGKVTKLRTDKILYGGGYIATWADDISGAFEVKFLEPTDVRIRESYFSYNKHEIIVD